MRTNHQGRLDMGCVDSWSTNIANQKRSSIGASKKVSKRTESC
jgi:hypothetical protein